MKNVNQILEKLNYAKQYSKQLYAKTKFYQKQYGLNFYD